MNRTELIELSIKFEKAKKVVDQETGSVYFNCTYPEMLNTYLGLDMVLFDLFYLDDVMEYNLDNLNHVFLEWEHKKLDNVIKSSKQEKVTAVSECISTEDLKILRRKFLMAEKIIADSLDGIMIPGNPERMLSEIMNLDEELFRILLYEIEINDSYQFDDAIDVDQEMEKLDTIIHSKMNS